MGLCASAMVRSVNKYLYLLVSMLGEILFSLHMPSISFSLLASYRPPTQERVGN